MDARIAAAFARWLDRVRVPLLIVLIGAVVSLGARSAAVKPLWHDELYTLLIARLPSWTAIWSAHRDGADLQPPFNTLVTRLVVKPFGTGPIAVRVPPLAGYALLMLVVALFVRRRAGITLALAGALIPLQTAAFRYSYEARGYGLLLGLSALALFGWAEAAHGRRRRVWIPTCAAALAASIWTHYYAGYVAGAIATGEGIRWALQRRIDRGMLGALIGAAVLTIPLVPLVHAAMAQSPRFWARAGDESVSGVYLFLFQPLIALLWSGLGALLAAALLYAIVAERRRSVSAEGNPKGAAHLLPLHETVVLVLLVVAPLVLLTIARLTPGAFTARYGLVAVVGAAIGIPLLIRTLVPRGSLVEGGLLVLLAWPLVSAWTTQLPTPLLAPDPVAERSLLAGALRAPGPVVASGSLSYLQFWYYAAPALRPRLVYLAEPDEALRITGTDTLDRGYLALARWAPLSVRPAEEFLRQHGEFRLYAAGSGWLLDALEQEGASFELLGSEPGGRLFRVTRR